MTTETVKPEDVGIQCLTDGMLVTLFGATGKERAIACAKDFVSFVEEHVPEQLAQVLANIPKGYCVKVAMTVVPEKGNMTLPSPLSE